MMCLLLNVITWYVVISTGFGFHILLFFFVFVYWYIYIFFFSLYLLLSILNFICAIVGLLSLFGITCIMIIDVTGKLIPQIFVIATYLIVIELHLYLYSKLYSNSVSIAVMILRNCCSSSGYKLLLFLMLWLLSLVLADL